MKMDFKDSASDTDIRINMGSLNVSLRTGPGPFSISVSGSTASSSMIRYHTGATAFTGAEAVPGVATSDPYLQAASGGPHPLQAAPVAAVSKSSTPVSGSKSDSGFCAPLPYYATPGPEDVHVSIMQSGIALPNATIGTVEMSGPERVRFAYAAGREAAKQLQGGTAKMTLFRIAGRSPALYIVLKGQLDSHSYPISVTTFKDYKKHVFLDQDRPRPQVWAPTAVGRAFYSIIEARAYSKGAGLSDIP